MKRKAISIILALAVLGNQVGITTVSAEGFVSGEPFAETDMQEYQTDDFVSGNTDSKNDNSDSYKSDDSDSDSPFGKKNSEESTVDENGLEKTYFGGKDSATTDQTTGSEGKENIGEGSEESVDISEKEFSGEIVDEQMESDETEDILETEASSGLAYGDYEYSVSENEVTITGYTGSDSFLVIPAEIDGKSVTEIGISVFMNCKNLKTVEIPESVKRIGRQAFNYCESIESISLPKEIEEVDDYAFAGCKKLQTIILPEGLKAIGYNFLEGTAVTSLTIPSTVEKGDCAIRGAEKLESITFAEGMKRIPGNFCNSDSDNTTLTYIEIPESVTAIGTYAFYNCKSIKIYGYSGSYAESYALENGIPFVSLGVAIGNCEYDYSGQIDQWLLDQGTSNAMNYLVKDKNFTNSMAVATFDTDFGERLTEA